MTPFAFIVNHLRVNQLRFSRSEQGSLAIFSILIFVAMLLVGGLAIDVMRHENMRLRLQDTTDRAALAAVIRRDNVSDATPEQIAESYFAAEGFSEQIAGRILVEEDPRAGRMVTMAPSGTVPTLFARLLGIDSFPLATRAQAVEAVEGMARIDLVMVLDVSGSMDRNDRIDEMRDAATELSQDLLEDSEEGRVSITIVPYNEWVLPPPGFLNTFENTRGRGACNDWRDWDSVTNSLSQPTWLTRCDTDRWAQVMPFQHDLEVIEEVIDELETDGVTSIDLGIRHGALYFDPSIRPAISLLVDNGLVDEMFRGRPLDWDESNVVRALILLTDGENCCGDRYDEDEQDENTLDVCSALREQGVLIYAIAFEAPPRGADLMRECASSPSHYFNADSDDLESIFEGIGTNIQTQVLRLTR